MDNRIQRMVSALKGSGYTDQFVADHWDSNWRQKRWFGLAGSAELVLQIITANLYTRIVLVDDGSKEPFAYLQYVSERSPERPKQEFFNGRAPDTSSRKDIEEILRLIPELEASIEQQEAA